MRSIVTPRVPRVQVDASQIDEPQQRCEILDDRKCDDVARAVRDRARLDPWRTRLRGPLHEKALARSTVGIALHHHRAVGEMRQQHGRHGRVVLQQVTFGDAALGPEGLAQVGQSNVAATDVQHDAFRIVG